MRALVLPARPSAFINRSIDSTLTFSRMPLLVRSSPGVGLKRCIWSGLNQAQRQPRDRRGDARGLREGFREAQDQDSEASARQSPPGALGLFAVDAADLQRRSQSNHFPVANPWAHSITRTQIAAPLASFALLRP